MIDEGDLELRVNVRGSSNAFVYLCCLGVVSRGYCVASSATFRQDAIGVRVGGC